MTQLNNKWALVLIASTEIWYSSMANLVIRETIWLPFSLRISTESPSSAFVLKAVVKTHSKMQIIKLKNPRMVTPSLSGMQTQHFFILRFFFASNLTFLFQQTLILRRKTRQDWFLTNHLYFALSDLTSSDEIQPCTNSTRFL